MLPDGRNVTGRILVRYTRFYAACATFTPAHLDFLAKRA